MENKTVIELQEELTKLIEKKTQELNIVNIDSLIERKRNEISEVLSLTANTNE